MISKNNNMSHTPVIPQTYEDKNHKPMEIYVGTDMEQTQICGLVKPVNEIPTNSS